MNGNTAQLYTDYTIENPSSCHSVAFKYSIAGENPGSLSLKLQTTSGDVVQELWFTDTATNGWTTQLINFRYFDTFEVRGPK